MKRDGVSLFSLFAIIAFFVVCQNLGAQTLIGRVNEWPPYYFLKNGEWTGHYVETYQALGKESGISIRLTVIPWSRAMMEMATQPIIIAGLTPIEARKKVMCFIGPHTNEEVAFASHIRYANTKIDSLDDLAELVKLSGKRIAYQQDVFHSIEFQERIESDTDFRNCFEKKAVYGTVREMTEQGRLAGFLEDKKCMINRINIKKSDTIFIHPFRLSVSEQYFGVSKTVPENIIEKLNDANKRLIEKGGYAQIEKKWDTHPVTADTE